MANESYIKSSSGILKGLEVVALLLAWVFFYEFRGESDPKDYTEWVAFFFFAHLIGWIATILLFGVFACGLHDNIGGSKCWYTIALVFHFALAICCIVGAGYWAKYANDKEDHYKNLFGEKYWNYLVVAVAASIVSFLLLMGDAFKSLRQVQNAW